MLRNLIFALSIFFFLFSPPILVLIKSESAKWFQSHDDNTTASKKREGVVIQHSSNYDKYRPFEIGELNVSDAFLLSNCIILHHWWIAIVGKNLRTFFWIHALEQRSILFMEMVLATCYVWFAEHPKEPPDKFKININSDSENQIIMNSVSFIIYFIEDILYQAFRINIDLCYWI